MSTEGSNISNDINVFTMKAKRIPNQKESSKKNDAPINDVLAVELIRSIVCDDDCFNIDEAFGYLAEACKKDGFQIAYSEIYKIVRESEKRDNLVEDSLFHCQRLISKCEDIDSKKLISKIAEHVRLCQLQIAQMLKLGGSITERIQKEINEANQETSRRIVSQLIGVVSIFTALAFILFGGISGITSLYELVSIGEKSLSIMIICFSLFAIIMLGCLCLFVYFIISIINPSKGGFRLGRITKCVIIPIAITLVVLLVISKIPFVVTRNYIVV